MRLEPILTEKTMNDAKEGKYTFWVSMGLDKFQVKKVIGEAFGVTVKKVWVTKKGGELRKTNTRHIRKSLPRKKVVVTLGEKDKIDLFEEVKKESKKKSKQSLKLK